LWKPALVLAALLPYGNFRRRARRRTTLADGFFCTCFGMLPIVR
jgi:hypothetical protein